MTLGTITGMRWAGRMARMKEKKKNFNVPAGKHETRRDF
jgi:hypothetical protein